MSPENTGPAAVIVLAAGAGTRMKSRTPKILHEIGGRSMVGHALLAARSHQPAASWPSWSGMNATSWPPTSPPLDPARPDRRPGRGPRHRPRRRSRPRGPRRAAPQQQLSGTVVVTYGDVPLLTGAAARRTRRQPTKPRATPSPSSPPCSTTPPATAASSGLQTEPSPASASTRTPPTPNAQSARSTPASTPSTPPCCATRWRHVTTDNAQGEKYLTDVLGLARAAGGRVAAVVTEDRWQVEGANDRVQLSALGAELNRRTVEAWMRAGVTVVDPATTWIDATVTLDEDVRLLPNTQLHGTTTVARDAVVGPDTTLTDVQVGEGAKVIRTHGSGSDDRRATPASAPSPTCAPAPSWARPARSAPSTRPRTSPSAAAPSCPTSATPATPRSARTPTSAAATSPPTTTARRSTAR